MKLKFIYPSEWSWQTTPSTVIFPYVVKPIPPKDPEDLDYKSAKEAWIEEAAKEAMKQKKEDEPPKEIDYLEITKSICG